MGNAAMVMVPWANGHQPDSGFFITRAKAKCLWLSYKSPEHGFPSRSADSTLTLAVQMVPQ